MDLVDADHDKSRLNDLDDSLTETSSSGSSEYLNLDIFIRKDLDGKACPTFETSISNKSDERKERQIERQRPLKRLIENEIDELNVMSNLNSRMFNFVNMVKSETLRSEELKESLLAKKQELVDQFKEHNTCRYENLMAAKQKLNDLCLDLSRINLRERQGRLLAKWYASQIHFEMENSSARNRSQVFSQSYLANQALSSYDLGENHSTHLKDDDFVFQRKPNDSLPELDTNLLMAAVGHHKRDHEHNESSSLKSSLSSLSSSSFSCTSSSSQSPSPVEFQSNSPPTSPGLFTLSSSLTSRSSSASISCSSSTTTAYQHLDLHLNSLIQQRIQLETDYEQKLCEYSEIKENVSVLENNLRNLHGDLAMVRIENTQLDQQVSLMQKEIEFYHKLKQTSKTENQQSWQARTSCNYDELVHKLCGQKWLQHEIEQVKKEVRKEFEEFNRLQLNEYEAELKAELMNEIDRNEKVRVEEDRKFDNESDEALDELSKLNQELSDGLEEYFQVLNENNRLNDRLIDLSTRMCSFSQLGQEQQERMVTCYSINTLISKIKMRNTEISNYKLELSSIKDYLIHKDLFGVLGQNEKKLKEIDLNINEVVLTVTEKLAASKVKEASFPAPSPARVLINSLNKFDLLSLMLIENFKHNPIRLSTLMSKQSARHSPKIKLRANYAQIEYSKSRLFGYFVINFDLINNSFQSSNVDVMACLASNKKPPTKSKSGNALSNSTDTKTKALPAVNASNPINSLNFLRIIDSSTDGHSIMIENSHKLLDFDLSEWTIRREIQNTTITGDLQKLACASIKSDFLGPMCQEPLAPAADSSCSKSKSCSDAMNYLAANLNAEPSNDKHEDSSSKNNLVEVVQFKFPKGFRLKRRKKIILVAADALIKIHPSTRQSSSVSVIPPVLPKALRRSTPTQPIAKPKASLPKSKTSLSLTTETRTQNNKAERPTTTSSLKNKPKFNSSGSMLSLSSPTGSAANMNPQVKSKTIPHSLFTNILNNQSISQSPPKISSLFEPASIKCSCCACTVQRVNLTRNGDTEIFEAKEVPNWGKGLMVVTKFINNKNVVKFINYKCIKNIWLNTSQGKDEINAVSS